MARRIRNDSVDMRDWKTRAAEQLSLAEQMPAGPARDAAINKAEQFRKAAEMMDFLRASDTEPSF